MSLYTKLQGIKESIKQDIKELGDKLQFFTPIAFIVWCACFGTNHLAIVFVVTFVIAMIIMSLCKALFNAPRPREVEGDDNPDLKLDWSPRDGNSWISGHSLSAFLGGIFWFQIDPILGCVGALLGLITGLSRIIAKAHWIRDVVSSVILSVILYGIDLVYFL